MRRFIAWTLLATSMLLLSTASLAEGKAQGRVTDEEGNPIAGVEIRLIPADRTDLPTTKVSTDRKGRYIIGLVRKATYRIAAFREGMRVAHIDGNLATPRDDSLWAYDGPISPGQTPPELSIDGLTDCTYDMVLVPDEGDPGEWGTGQPLVEVSEIVQRISLGDVDGALKEVRRNLSAAPDSASLNYLLAFGLLQKQDTEGATEAIDRCLASDPNLEGANLIRGKLYEATGDGDSALASYRKEIAVAESTQVKRDALIAASLLLLNQKKMDQAVVLLEQVAELDPENVPALKELANCYVNLGEKEKAEQVLAKVSALGGSEDPSVLYNLGADAFNKGDFETAAGRFQKAVELKDDFAEAWLQLAYCKVNLGQMPEAIEAMKKFIELQPEGEAADNARQMIQALSGN